jgi:hypothetical protein
MRFEDFSEPDGHVRQISDKELRALLQAFRHEVQTVPGMLRAKIYILSDGRAVLEQKLSIDVGFAMWPSYEELRRSLNRPVVASSASESQEIAGSYESLDQLLADVEVAPQNLATLWELEGSLEFNDSGLRLVESRVLRGKSEQDEYLSIGLYVGEFARRKIGGAWQIDRKTFDAPRGAVCLAPGYSFDPWIAMFDTIGDSGDLRHLLDELSAKSWDEPTD